MTKKHKILVVTCAAALLITGLFVFAGAIGAIGDVKVNCYYTTADKNACMFTNTGFLFPARKCIQPKLVYDGAADLKVEGSMKLERKAHTICSGYVWGKSTTKVPFEWKSGSSSIGIRECMRSPHCSLKH
jgi:hypothetical protein